MRVVLDTNILISALLSHGEYGDSLPIAATSNWLAASPRAAFFRHQGSKP